VLKTSDGAEISGEKNPHPEGFLGKFFSLPESQQPQPPPASDYEAVDK
jgi:hypothetical protein